MLTVCITALQTETSQGRQICYTEPTPDPERGGPMNSSLRRLVREAKEDRGARTADAPETIRLKVLLYPGADPTNYVRWLDANNIPHRDPVENSWMVVTVPVLLLPELAEIETIRTMTEHRLYPLP